MSNYIVDGSELTSIADAIRAKSGGSGQLAFPSGFVSEIGNIPSGGGGDYTAADFADKTKPSGDVTFDAAFIGVQNSNQAPNYFAYRTAITKLYGPNYNNTGNATAVFGNMTSLQYAVLPKCTKLYNNCFVNCTKLTGIDILGGSIGSTVFSSCGNLNLIILRKDSAITSLSNTNSLQTSKFNKAAGGTIYIPKALYDHLGDGTSLDFKSSSNWATVDGWGHTTWAKIEGSYYETHYVDGTLIPT